MGSSNAQNLCLLLLLFFGLNGCAALSKPKPDSGAQPVEFATDTATIATINRPANVNTIVQVKGKVGNHAPMLGKTAYELQDATGSLWILASDPTPKTGDEVVVKGKLVYQSIPLNGKEQGSMYLEQQQLQYVTERKS